MMILVSFGVTLSRRIEVSKIMVKLVKYLKESKGYEVKYLRCDSAGENAKTQEACLEAGLGIIFEFTVINTKQ